MGKNSNKIWLISNNKRMGNSFSQRKSLKQHEKSKGRLSKARKVQIPVSIIAPNKLFDVRNKVKQIRIRHSNSIRIRIRQPGILAEPRPDLRSDIICYIQNSRCTATTYTARPYTSSVALSDVARWARASCRNYGAAIIKANFPTGIYQVFLHCMAILALNDSITIFTNVTGTFCNCIQRRAIVAFLSVVATFPTGILQVFLHCRANVAINIITISRNPTGIRRAFVAFLATNRGVGE